jgi:hypothetical protein
VTDKTVSLYSLLSVFASYNTLLQLQSPALSPHTTVNSSQFTGALPRPLLELLELLELPPGTNNGVSVSLSGTNSLGLFMSLSNDLLRSYGSTAKETPSKVPVFVACALLT